MSFLRWAGSKKQLSEVLANCWFAAQCAGGSGRYIEAFCGSASLFFHLQPRESILLDINRSLIECYEIVKSRPGVLKRTLDGYGTGAEFYYALRAQSPKTLTKVQRAARFVYLNRYCFNGLYRTNMKGDFNVPYGAGRNGALPTLSELKNCSKILKSATILCGDFEQVSKNVKKGDFVYLDPPYAKRNHSLDLQYGPDVFGVVDLQRILLLLRHIDKIGAYFVFSYVECNEIAEIVDEWNSFTVEVKRTIAADSSKRTKLNEVLISNI